MEKEIMETRLRKVSSKIHKEPKNNIRIKKSNNLLKLAVARVCSSWLSAVDRSWEFNGSIDKNSDRLKKYLENMFADFNWLTLPSQTSFDIISLDAKIAIEVKSVKNNNKKLMSNASIYPEKVKAINILPTNLKNDVDENLELDVLVVCINRNSKNKVYDYAIVDGSYWGFKNKDFQDCQKMFNNLNNKEFVKDLFELYKEHFPEESDFVDKIQAGTYGNSFSFSLRKLIQISNPVGKSLDMSGVWL